jgi:uncharacterized membrane protein YphA (DoxX/SURF4 family)
LRDRAVIATFDRRFFAPAPAERLATLRVLIGSFGVVYLAVRSVHISNVARLPHGRFEPVGVVRWLDEPAPLWVVRAVVIVTLAAGVAFVAGWHYRIAAPIYAVGLLGALTYANSWQHVAHTENLLVLHTAVLAIAPAAVVWSRDARRVATRSWPEPAAVFGWPVRLITLLTVITYALAGVAKVRHGGFDWVTGDVLRNLIAHDNLRKITLGDVHSPIGGWIVRYGWLFPPVAVMSLAVELGAPLALLGGRIRLVWVAAAWLFHVGVLLLMAILFVYPLSGVAYASMLQPEVLVRRVGGVLSRRRTHPASSRAPVAAYGPRDA